MYTYLVCEKKDFQLPVALFERRSELLSYLGITSRQFTQALYRYGFGNAIPLGSYLVYVHNFDD